MVTRKERIKKEDLEIVKLLGTPEIDRWNKSQIEQAQKEHLNFKNDFAKGVCWHCHKPIEYLDIKEPCYHWLFKS